MERPLLEAAVLEEEGDRLHLSLAPCGKLGTRYLLEVLLLHYTTLH